MPIPTQFVVAVAVITHARTTSKQTEVRGGGGTRRGLGKEGCFDRVVGLMV